jgi:hypothetical protein
MRVRRQTAIGEVDAPAIEELAAFVLSPRLSSFRSASLQLTPSLNLVRITPGVTGPPRNAQSGKGERVAVSPSPQNRT